MTKPGTFKLASVSRPYLYLYSSFSLIISVFCLLSCSSSVVAQKPAPDDEEVLRVNTDLLLFPIRIRDDRKQAVNAVAETDLSLKDPDRVTSGLYFMKGLDRISVVFALDQSGSTRDIIKQQRDAAIALFSRFNERSKIAVIRFADVPVVAARFGRDEAAVRGAFDFTSERNKPTAIFDAAALALDAFSDLPKVRSERRIVILISDGLDTASTVKPDLLIAAANKVRVSYYVIHLPLFEPGDDRLEVRRPAKGFRELAEKTNGKYFLGFDRDLALSPVKTVDLSKTFQAIEDDLRSQYLLGFYLNETANDGRKHRFSLSMPKSLEYQIVGSQGYDQTQDFIVHRPKEFFKTRAY